MMTHGFPWQSALWLRAACSPLSPSVPVPLCTPPHPQRLAPVVLLRLAVGFVQAFAGTPRVPRWRGDLVRPSVLGSVEMCGRRRGAVAVGQAALCSGLHLALDQQGSGRGGCVADSPR